MMSGAVCAPLSNDHDVIDHLDFWFWSADDRFLCEEQGKIMSVWDISIQKSWSDFDQFIINYRDIVEKPSPHGGGCDVLDMWPDLGASMKKWEWPGSNGTDEKWKCPFKAFWLKCQ